MEPTIQRDIFDFLTRYAQEYGPEKTYDLMVEEFDAQDLAALLLQIINLRLNG